MDKDWTLTSGTNVKACVRSSALNLDYALRSGDPSTLRDYARRVCLQLDALVGEMGQDMSTGKKPTSTANLEAGPPLDAEIARRVFRFWYTDEDVWGPQWWAHHPITPGANCYPSVALGNLWGVHVDQRNGLPKFSTDIEAAWKVVEKLEFFELTTLGVGKELHWRATFFLPKSARDAHGYGDSAPLAICRAALDAMGATS